MGDMISKPLKGLGALASAPITILSGLLPKPPKVTPPMAMPDPLDTAAAKRRTAAQAAARSGRESTILSDTLGP